MLVADALVARTPQRSETAFADVYERYYPMIYAYVLRRIGDRAEAEDITAHTFVRALQSLERYEERGTPIGAWLLRIATNALIDELRRRRRLELWTHAAMRSGAGATLAEVQQEDWAARYEGTEWLGTHLGSLTTLQRRALWLRFGTDCTVREVAAQLGRSESATKALLRRTLLRLRSRMQLESW
jgi:RNA polymerase sigma-70 factor (ECF subfamily)